MKRTPKLRVRSMDAGTLLACAAELERSAAIAESGVEMIPDLAYVARAHRAHAARWRARAARLERARRAAQVKREVKAG